MSVTVTLTDDQAKLIEEVLNGVANTAYMVYAKAEGKYIYPDSPAQRHYDRYKVVSDAASVINKARWAKAGS